MLRTNATRASSNSYAYNADSGAEHGLMRDIGIVNLVHRSGQPGEFAPIDYRIDDPTADGQTKNDQFREMLLYAIVDKRIKARTVLFDFWSGSANSLKLLHQPGLIFFTTSTHSNETLYEEDRRR